MKIITDEERLGPMFNPPHPGQVIEGLLLPELGLTPDEAADRTGIDRASFSDILQGKLSISPDLAEAIARGLGASTGLWLGLQQQYDGWIGRQAMTGESL